MHFPTFAKVFKRCDIVVLTAHLALGLHSLSFSNGPQKRLPLRLDKSTNVICIELWYFNAKFIAMTFHVTLINVYFAFQSHCSVYNVSKYSVHF